MDKAQRYDRQLRLWHANGQTALENAKVCLINGTATGCEVLKNLILPGIGSYVIVDCEVVTGAQAGNNFFLDATCIGKPRAERVCGLLQELNEDVKGDYLNEDPISVINSRPEYFVEFTIVIATDLPEHPLRKLAAVLFAAKVPLVVVRSFGFHGYLRVAVPDHAIVETHPENIYDLRLDCPWPELEEFAESIDLNALDSMEHAHVPFVVVLLKYLAEWKQSHDGKAPSTSQEKNQFKQKITSGKRTFDQENFEEALSSVWQACTTTKIPSNVEAIFKDPLCEKLTRESTNFWILARAVRDFVANEGDGTLPLTGKVPDMKADTKSYVALQTIYRAKAQQDFAMVRARVVDLLGSLGRSSGAIPTAEVEAYCKNASFAQIILYRSLEQEYDPTTAKKELIARALEEEDRCLIQYVILRAIDRFYEKHGRKPNAATWQGGLEGNRARLEKKREADPEEDYLGDPTDYDELAAAISGLFKEWGGIEQEPSMLSHHLHEACRSASAELPSTAALMGGLASQEAIKLITRQYIPINNTCLFDGITSASAVYEL